ncbi:protein ripply2 [Echinops telfairi]|uniref:Protein ripply2 n=1 Tax=Echinops telfairi TaxID=9371 RepID=A0ABM0IBU8_ECHTE|nr:protein ripply2 [Echinops telfairi]
MSSFLNIEFRVVLLIPGQQLAITRREITVSWNLLPDRSHSPGRLPLGHPRAPPLGSPPGRLLPRLGSRLLRALSSLPRRSAGFWRPWVDPRGDTEDVTALRAAKAVPDSPGVTDACGKLSHYRHPVRLFWPKSKCYDYLYQEAEALLKNFPIQATISFYEDSDSEDEIGELTCDLEN